MKALVFHKTKDVRVDEVPDPRIENARDVILRVTSASICGSDLHVYNGYLPRKQRLVMGHEFMGVVEEIGPRVRNLKKGDRVVVPFSIACGECFFCARGLHPHCERTGGGVFGFGDERGSYRGGQAQYVRVPYADVGPRKVPAEASDEQVLFLGDIIPTGWTAVEWCELRGGETVAVFGCGPVGLMAMKAARLQGAGVVIGIDVLEYRRKEARRATGAEIIDPGAIDPVEAIRELTDGRGADACIDAVGMEADHGFMESVSNVLHRQVGTIKVLRSAIAAARRGGAISAVGAYGAAAGDFPVDEIFEKGLRLRSGPVPVSTCIDKLLPMVLAGKLTAEDIVTHRLPLDEAPRAYRIFNDKLENCIKVVLKPWAETAPEAVALAESRELDVEAAAAFQRGVMPPPYF